jgi:hypothetical protein
MRSDEISALMKSMKSLQRSDEKSMTADGRPMDFDEQRDLADQFPIDTGEEAHIHTRDTFVETHSLLH